MDLSGTWRAANADEGLRRVYAAPGFDDNAWAAIPVPSHWRTAPAFATSDGPVLYRRPFEAAVPAAGRRSWLTFEGIFYDGDVWLDGSYLGPTEGYFFGHSFEISDALRAQQEHLLAVEVGCAPQSDLTAKRNLTGVFQHWDCIDRDWNPGGIWRPVRVEESGPVRITALRVLCSEASDERAQLSVRAELDAAEAAPALIRVSVEGRSEATSITRHSLAHGANRIRLQLAVEQPALWWPHALGEQHLHTLTVEVLVPFGEASPARRRDDAVTAEELEGHVPSDSRRLTVGLRQVRMHNFVFTVNGERLFLKGSNQGPARTALADADPVELERDVLLAKEAGLDLLRIHGHVSRPELYDAADRHGMLLWQDLPLQWGYARSVRKQAVRQARLAADLLGHHPSVAIWCGHNEPMALAHTDSVNPARYVALQELPTWNKTILDASVSRALERADPTRPVVAHSGVWPGPVGAGTDTHVYFGWYHGDERDFPRLLAAVPRLARFVSEFGAQAVPDSADFMHPDAWPDLDWEGLASHHALQLDLLDRRVPRSGTFEEWRAATQAYQATVVRFHVEALRRLKYRPTGGFCQFSLADSQPGVTWSVLDHRRVPKRAYEALARACAPVVVLADRPAPEYAPGDPITLDVHVVSDLRRPLTGVRVVAALGAWRTGWSGEIPADGVVRVGTVTTAAPAESAELTLSLDGDGVRADNSYPIVVGQSSRPVSPTS